MDAAGSAISLLTTATEISSLQNATCRGCFGNPKHLLFVFLEPISH
jgi:hypothetical protein